MPKKDGLTPKQEAFARKYVELGNASEAYRQAYNVQSEDTEWVKVEACKLLQDPNVSQTVITLQDELRERTLVTVESITKKLEEAQRLAKETANPNALTSAVMGEAKVNGLLIEKVDKKTTHEVGDSIKELMAEVNGKTRTK